MAVGQDPAEAARLEEERRLIERAQRGDRDALRPILERYAQPLYAGILPRVGDVATAEDVLRDTFLAAMEKIGSFQWQGHGLYGWLRQIAMNKVMDVHRRTRRAGRLALALAEELPRETSRDEAADSTLIAEEERRRSAVKIQAVLGVLLPRYREAIQLRLVEELPREECARRLGVTIGHFDVLLFRAIRAFRKRFGDGDEGD